MIRAILIDDEAHCLDTLGILLADYCPEVQVLDRCESAKKGLEAIREKKPDLVFLDIEMPVMNGFEMLEQFKEIHFSIIFTTGYDQYAIKAIRFSALDYLLKPVDPKELVAAIHKVQTQKQSPTGEQFGILLNRIKTPEESLKKFAIPTAEGFELIPFDEVIRCEADDNYTHFFLKNQKKLTACRTMKEMGELLQDFHCFVRVHHSHIVNLNEVTRFVRGEGGYLVMNDGSTVSVSRSRKEELLNLFQKK